MNIPDQQRRSGPRGFTLAELMISMAIMSVLMLGMSSAIMISSRAVESSTSVATEGVETREAFDQLTTDLRYATSIDSLTPTSLTVTVPDRTGDKTDDTIAYTWNPDNEALGRTINGGQNRIIAQNVKSLSFEMNTAPGTADVVTGSTDPAPPPPNPADWGGFETTIPVPADETTDGVLLMYHDNPLSVTLAGKWMSPMERVGQGVLPTLPSNTWSYEISSVFVRLKQDADLEFPTSRTTMGLSNASLSLKPSGLHMGTASVANADLGSDYRWGRFDFDPPVYRGWNQKFGISLFCDEGSDQANSPARVEWENSGDPMTADTKMTVSVDGGTKWAGSGDAWDIRFYAYGSVTTEGPPEWPDGYPFEPETLPVNDTDSLVLLVNSDAEEATDGTMTIASLDLDLGEQTCGLQFAGVAIPDGAEIARAYIELTARITTTESSEYDIVAQDATDGAAFSGSDGDITSRPTTLSFVQWFPGAWTAGQTYNTADLTPLIQELRERSGWTAGDPLVFIISGRGHREAATMNHTTLSHAKLHVEFWP